MINQYRVQVTRETSSQGSRVAIGDNRLTWFNSPSQYIMNTQMFSDGNIVHEHTCLWKGLMQPRLTSNSVHSWLTMDLNAWPFCFSFSGSEITEASHHGSLMPRCERSNPGLQARQASLYQLSRSPSLRVAYKPAQCCWATGGLPE